MKKFLPWILAGLGLWWILRQTGAGGTQIFGGGSGVGGSNSSSTTTTTNLAGSAQTSGNSLLGNLFKNSNLGSAVSAALGELFTNISDAISGAWTPTANGGSPEALPPGLAIPPDPEVDSTDVPPAIVGFSPAENAGTTDESIAAAQSGGGVSADLTDLTDYGGNGGGEDFGGDTGGDASASDSDISDEDYA